VDFRQSYVVQFTPAEIFAAWTSSSTVISPATAMDIEPVVGGHYRLIMDMAEGAVVAEGRFLLVEQDRNLRYTWEWNADGEITLIDVTLTAIPTGTQIDIHHSGFNSTESADRHAAGWDNYIDGLSKFLARQRPD